MNEANHILVERQDSVLLLGINRPHKKNALTREMYTTLCEELLGAKTDPQIKVVLIYGENNIFSAGNDLKDFDSRKSGDKSPAELFLTILHEFEKPIVASVPGIAIGIGVTMLIHCDLVYAAPDTRFSMPFVNLGVIPEGASSLLLPLNAGYKKAARALLLGDFFTTQDAIDLDIVTEAVTNDNLFEYARQMAVQLSQKPCQAVLLTKQLLKSETKKNVADRIVQECKLFETLLLSEESITAREKIKNAGKKN